MPPLPPTPNVIKLSLQGVCQNQNVDNVFHVQFTGGPPLPTNLAADAVTFGAEFITQFGPFLHQTYSLKQVIATDLTSSSGAVGEGVITSGSGSDASAIAPLSCCAVISWRINRRYRGGKPRTYLGPVGGNTAALGKLIPTGQATAIANAAEAFRTFVDTNAWTSATTWDLGCVSYFSGKVLRTAGLFEGFVANPSVDLRLGSQRRRLGKLSATREI